MRLSVVIPYYNRRKLLLNVLTSIHGDLEVVIVDDGSSVEHQVDDIINNYEFDIKLIKLPVKTQWRGPTVAYNVGFSEASGNVIMINSSECVHIGDIIGYVFKNFEPNDYIAFSAFMGMPNMNVEFNDPDFIAKGEEVGAWWGVHSTIKNLIPYCGVISKENMDRLGGYDMRFASGIGWDDYDFTHRVKNLGLNTKIVDKPFCFHQYHDPTVYHNYNNLHLLEYLNITEPNRIKANG